MIIWDTTLNSVLLTLLQPTLYKSYLRSWLMSDIHQHLALDMVGNVGEQKWYAFDDMMVTLPSSLVLILSPFPTASFLVERRSTAGWRLWRASSGRSSSRRRSWGARRRGSGWRASRPTGST